LHFAPDEQGKLQVFVGWLIARKRMDETDSTSNDPKHPEKVPITDVVPVEKHRTTIY
jgi:hypothetical protein